MVHPRSRHAGILSQFPGDSGTHDARVVVLSVEIQVFDSLNPRARHKAVERNFKGFFATVPRRVTTKSEPYLNPGYRITRGGVCKTGVVLVVARHVRKNGSQAVGRNRDVDTRHYVGPVEFVRRRLGQALSTGSDCEKA